MSRPRKPPITRVVYRVQHTSNWHGGWTRCVVYIDPEGAPWLLLCSDSPDELEQAARKHYAKKYGKHKDSPEFVLETVTGPPKLPPNRPA